jgi:hypothetical protein
MLPDRVFRQTLLPSFDQGSIGGEWQTPISRFPFPDGRLAMMPPRYCDVMVPSGNLLLPRNVQNRLYPPNDFNACLSRDKAVWESIQLRGGLMSICPGKKYVDPPWVKMPGQGKRFSPIGSLALASITPGVDTLVTSLTVPLGYDGVIFYIVQTYSGQGFQDGDGQITWRIKQNQRYVKNYGNTTVQLGSLNQGGPTSPNSQIILLSDQYVQYYVNVAVGNSLNGGRITCALWGYYWPR